MQSISLRTHVGPDGVLKLRVPIDARDTDMEVIVILQPTRSEPGGAGTWPPAYFEETYGSLADEPLERPPQGDFEAREALR